MDGPGQAGAGGEKRYATLRVRAASLSATARRDAATRRGGCAGEGA
ncbi:DUF6380 family protein [Streptomyces sp. NPDC002309]